MSVSLFRRTKASLITLLLGLTLILTACSGAQNSTNNKPLVVTEIYPMQFIAEQVGKEHVKVENLTPAGVDAHGYELTPEQIAKISDAKLVIYQKGYQGATDDAVAATGKSNSLQLGDLIELIPYENDENGFAQNKNIYSYDTHTWLDPNNMTVFTQAVADKLAEIDPEHGNDYQENAKKLIDELSALDKDFRSGLANCKRHQFIPSHTAFGYLAKRYNLTQIPIAGLSPDQEPSPARIAEIQKLAKEYGITTIFYERLASPELSKRLSEDLGLQTDVLDPIEGLTADSQGDDYLAIMRTNLDTLRKANECQ